MICFGIKTNKEVKEKVTCGSHLKKKKANGRRGRASERRFDLFFFIYFSLTSIFDIRKSDRQNSSGQERKGSTQQGLRMGTKNTGFRRVFN